MNDDFLYHNRPPLRKAFADGLYQHLSELELDAPAQRRRGFSMRQPVTHWNTWKFALPALLTVTALAFVLAVSQPVRAGALQWIKTVAGFVVEERSESPLEALSPGEPSPAETAAANPIGPAGTAAPAPTPLEPTVYLVPTLALPDVLENPPFRFGFPTWVPDGYTLDQVAGVAVSKSWVSFTWNNPDRAEIQLLVEQEYNGYAIPAGEDSSQEIQVNGTPALLIRGFWDAGHQWDARRGISLGWVKDGVHYRLSYFERDVAHNEIKPIEGDMEAIILELVKMAESVP